MKEFQQVENSIKEKFQEYSPDVDNALVWTKVNNGIRKKKKKRRFIIFFFLGLIGTCVCLTINSYEKPIHDENDLNEISDIEKDGDLLVAGNTFAEKKKVKEDIYDTERAVNLKTKTGNDYSQLKRQEDDFLQKAGFGDSTNPNLLEQADNTKETESIQKDIVAFNKRTTAPFEYINRIKQRLSLKSQRIENNFDFLLVDTNNEQPIKKWFMNYEIGISKPMANFSQIDNNTQELQFRNNLQKPMEALNGTLSLGYKFNKKLSGNIGLRYVKMNMQAALNSSDTLITIDDKWNFSGDRYINTQTQTTQIRTLEVSRYSSIQWLSIQAELSYEFIRRKKFSLNFLAGYDRSVWSKRKGFTLDSVERNYDTSADEEKRYKSKFSDTFYYGISLGHFINPSWRINLNASHRILVYNTTTKNAPVHEKYNFLGIAFGTSHFF